ncbi:MAG TPA: Tim44 domain-containing protein [Geomobilimonas sp.]|nr:Tim44 domain-containing protein [Geomobilimonas sp.]
MIRKLGQLFAMAIAVLFLSLSVLEMEASARAGGGRSFGSRGSRSYSRPASPYTQPSPSRQVAPQQQPTTPPPFQQPQPAGGGFLRSMAGGLVGGMLGGMLFRSLGFGGGAGMGGSGIGLFEILLLAGIGYFIFRMVKRRREAVEAGPSYYNQTSSGQGGYQPPAQAAAQSHEPDPGDVAAGLAHIRQMDSSFDENRFNDNVMDIFFKIQGAWMNRDLAPVTSLLTDEMRRVFQEDVDKLLADKKVNRLENIAVRSVEVVEAWQESGQDFITALIYANLLDYTTDDTTGQVVTGSKTDPVKFEEYWTFTRPVGNNPWKLSGIDQK